MPNPSTETAISFLDGLRRSDLAALLAHAEVVVGTTGSAMVVVVRCPSPFCDALDVLPSNDRQRIAEAAMSDRLDAKAPADIIVKRVGDRIEGSACLLPDLIIHKDMMSDVATGGRAIQDVDDYYGARQAKIVEACAAVGIIYDNPHSSLWDWYHHWKAEFPSYAQRREYLRNLFGGPIAAATSRVSNPSPVAERAPTGWERVDRALANARSMFAKASTEEEWQTVGLVCREVLISLAQAVFDPNLHEPVDGVKPSATDANRMTEAYVQHAFPGESYKEVRGQPRSPLQLLHRSLNGRTRSLVHRPKMPQRHVAVRIDQPTHRRAWVA